MILSNFRWRRRIKIALVGRPNVGKSALFNRIVGQKISIVDEREGVTRDRIYGQAELFNTPFEIIDTGGIDPHSHLPFQDLVKKQTEIAIREANALIMVVDAQVGVTMLDELVARLLRPLDKPVCLAVNKIDTLDQEWMVAPFHALGIKSLAPVSASHGLYIAELLQLLLSSSQPDQEESCANKGVSVAIIGRANVGKSTLLNFLLSEERALVSAEAGTTRDAIDASSQVGDTLFHWIDTAGIRRKKAEKEAVEKYAAIRTQRAIKRADICLLMLDVRVGLTTQEKRILSLVEAEGKGCLLLMNKWDLVSGYRMEHCLREMQRAAPFTRHCPTIFGSAKTGKSLAQLFPLLKKIDHGRRLRITTGELNQFIVTAVQKRPPPMRQGRRLRIYYLTQVATTPPRFILFVNAPSLMSATYQKYLLNQFRDHYQFTGTPLAFHLKKKAPPKQKEANKNSSALTWDEIAFERADGRDHTPPVLTESTP